MSDLHPVSGAAARGTHQPAVDLHLAEPRLTLAVADAARVLGVSSSTLRRWSDGGRVTAVRTVGGHRRYFEDDVLTLKRDADSAQPPMLRPVRLPDTPIANLGVLLSDEGIDILRRAVFLLYVPGREGWFGSVDGAARLDAWLTVLCLAAVGGASWETVINAADELATDARHGGARPREGPVLFELIGDLVQHRLQELGSSIDSRGATRRLIRAAGRAMMAP